MTMNKKPARRSSAPKADQPIAAVPTPPEIPLSETPPPVEAAAPDTPVTEAAMDVAEVSKKIKVKPVEKDRKGKDKKRRKKEKKSKEAVIIRFDDDQLPQIDGRASALGLSRAAWVRMVVAQALVHAAH